MKSAIQTLKKLSAAMEFANIDRIDELNALLDRSAARRDEADRTPARGREVLVDGRARFGFDLDALVRQTLLKSAGRC